MVFTVDVYKINLFLVSLANFRSESAKVLIIINVSSSTIGTTLLQNIANI